MANLDAGLLQMRRLGRKLIVGTTLGLTVIGMALALANRNLNFVLVSAAALTSGLALFAAWRWGVSPLARQITSMALMAAIALVLAAMRGHGYQVDVHMVFFAALSVVAMYCCWRSIVAAAGVVAVHHLLLNFVQPALVFPGGTDLSRVLIHAVILVSQAGALIWMVQQLYSSMCVSARAAEAAEESSRTVQELAQRDQQAAAEQAQRRERVAVAIARFREAVGQMLQRTGAQSDSLSQLSVEVGEAAAQGGAVAGNAREAAESACAMVESVAAAAEQLSSSINALRNQVDATASHADQATQQTQAAAEAFAALTEAAREIDSVVSLIQGITRQTNLLALNATIEAARAGDAGKGFAVVAVEVKTLAERTAEAAGGIAAQIAAIQASVERSESAMRLVAEGIREVRSSTSEAAHAISQQDAAANEIARSIAVSAEGSRRLAGDLQIAAKAAGRTDSAVGQLQGQSRQLREAADQLDREIRTFLKDVA